jgi:hypothetical protein
MGPFSDFFLRITFRLKFTQSPITSGSNYIIIGRLHVYNCPLRGLNLRGRRPIRLQTDKGTELTNRVFQKFLKEHDVHFFTTYNEETKASIVERFTSVQLGKYPFLNVRLALLSRTLSPGENLHDFLGPFLPYSLLDDVYKIQSVLKKRRKGRRVQYLVKWLGYPESFNSWIFKQDLQKRGVGFRYISLP